jgi:hypothetical protein
VELRLDRAEQLLDQRRYAGARDELAQARRDLAGVTDPGRHASLQDRLTRLQDRLAAESAAPAKDDGASDKDAGKDSGRDSGKDSGKDPGRDSGRGSEDDGTTGDRTWPDAKDSGPAGDGSGGDRKGRPDKVAVPPGPPLDGGSTPGGSDGFSAPAGAGSDQAGQGRPAESRSVEQGPSADLGAARDRGTAAGWGG